MPRLNPTFLVALLSLGLSWLAAPTSAAPSIGSPAVTPSAITAGTPTTVTATAVMVGGTPLAGGVNLVRQDATGKNAVVVGLMHDDGKNGDAVAGDNVYTLQTILNEPAGTVYFSVSAAFKGQLKRAASAPFTVTVNPVPAPKITDFAPKSAAVGDPVTVTGTGFAPPSGGLPQVSLTRQGGGTVGAPVTAASATSLTFTVPAGADSGPITVTAGGPPGVSASSLTVTSAAPPALTSGALEASVLQGQSTTYTLSFGPDPGFTQLVTLSLSGLPAGVTAQFAPAQITSGQFSTLTVTASAAQPVGTFALTVTASATVNGVPESQTLPLTLHVLLVTTSFIGRTVVADAAQTPLAGVQVTFLGQDGNGKSTGANATTVSDASGNFTFTNLPANYVGNQLIKYDGLTATAPPGKYCGVDLAYKLVANQVTTSPVLIRLPRLDNAETVMVPQNAATDQVFTFQTLPNLSVIVYAHTTFTLPDGTQPDPFPLIAIQVPVDRLPDVMPPMQSGIAGFIVAFQPANTVSSQPVAVTFPNALMTPAGTNVPLSTLDPTKGIMVQYGTGTVSPDGTQIVPDPDPTHPGHRYGLVHFDWHLAQILSNLLNATLDFLKQCTGFPVDLATGIETLSETDIGISGPRGAVALTRNYRTFTNIVGPFGLGASHNYDYRLTINRSFLDLLSLKADSLVMPDGGTVPFALQPGGTLTNSTIPAMRGVIITLVNTKEADLRWKDGTIYHFGPDTYLNGPVLTRITDRNGNAVTITRDPTNPLNVTQVADPVGRSLAFRYDSSNRIISVTDPIGRKVSYTYNALGALATVTNPAGGVTTYDYETGAANQTLLTVITDARGTQVVKNTYDGNGRVIQQDMADGGSLTIDYTLINPLVPTSPVEQTVVTDPLGHKTTYRYNPQAFLLGITNASGQQKTFKIASGTNLLLGFVGNPSDASVIPSPGDTAYTYDANGNILTATDAMGQKTTFTYELVYNQITSVIDANSYISTFNYDTKGNLLTATDANGKTTTFAYNGFGQIVSITDPLGKKTTMTYDGNGNLLTVTDRLGYSSTIHYDAVSRPLQTTDALGHTSSVQYDPLNQVTQQTDPLGHTVNLAYDANGNLLSLIDALNHANSFTYDPLNRLLTRKTPLGKTDTRQYDLAGNLIKFTDRRGQASIFSYDVLNRLTGENYQDGSQVARTYDTFGRLLNVVDTAGGSFSYAYDLDSRLLGSVAPNGAVQYAYDSAGQRTARQVAGQSPVQYGYDPAGRLLSAAMPQAALGFAYNDRNEVTSITRGNGVSSAFEYDAAGHLLSLAHTSGVTPLYSHSYSYDANGQRIASGTSSAQPLITQPVVNTYDAGNRLLTSGATSYAYDDDGNLISETGPSGTVTYTWDTRGRLTSLTNLGVKMNFVYDVAGNLLAQADSAGIPVHTYLLDDLTNVVAESDHGVPSAVLTGLGIDDHFAVVPATGSALYGLSDALNSTVEVTDSNGAIKSRFAYEAFGQTTASGSDYLFQYTGRVPISSNLYYYRTRFYNPILGRFISEDPTGFNEGINNYAYANGNPVTNSDPFGLDPHAYTVKDFICSIQQPSCDPQHVFQLLRQYPAPGAAGDHPVSSGDKTHVTCLGNVSHTVDNNNLSVTNTALPDHVLYPGVVTRTVIEEDGNIYIQSYGTGDGVLPWVNKKLAPLVWGSTDSQIRAPFDLPIQVPFDYDPIQIESGLR